MHTWESGGNVLCLIAMDCIGNPCGDKKNDEGGHLQAISAQSTTFNAPLEWWSTYSARARVGLRGPLGGSKVVNNEFFQICS